MEPAVKKLNRESFCLRILWMLLYALAWQVAAPLLMLIVLLQVVYRVFKGQPHAGLARLGGGIGAGLHKSPALQAFRAKTSPGQ